MKKTKKEEEEEEDFQRVTKEKRDLRARRGRAGRRDERRGAVAYAEQRDEMRGMSAWRLKTPCPLLKGNYVIANSTPNEYIKRAPAFNKMDRYTSINSNAHSFTNIKRNFFPKVAFYTYQTLFLGWLF